MRVSFVIECGFFFVLATTIRLASCVFNFSLQLGLEEIERTYIRLIFPSPPLQGRVLLRPPKPQRHLGGGQPGGAAFLAGFFPAPPPPRSSIE